jgi:hypothetical protein
MIYLVISLVCTICAVDYVNGYKMNQKLRRTANYEIKGTGLIHSDEEYLVVTRKINIFALYNVNKHSMPRQKREKSGTGICHVMQGKESKTCPSDSSS